MFIEISKHIHDRGIIITLDNIPLKKNEFAFILIP